MLQRSARLQYLLLAIVAFFALTHLYLGFKQNFYTQANGRYLARVPFFGNTRGATLTSLLPEATAAGLKADDTILTVNGRPFTGNIVLSQEVRHSQPNQLLDVTFVRPGNSAPSHASIVLAPIHTQATTLWGWIVLTVISLLAAFCLFTGLYVVLAKPRNPHAWLILGILGYFDALFVSPSSLHGPLVPIAIIWSVISQTAMPLCLMGFGIYFPDRSTIDIRFPWIKWLFVLLIVSLMPFDMLQLFGHNYNFALVRWLDPYLNRIFAIDTIASFLAICYFFICLLPRIRTATGDARRRLRILYLGTSIGLAPFFVLLFIAIVRKTDVGAAMPEWIVLTIVGILFLFPLTLAYVVVVQRAMDVRILIRQGTKYFFARQSIVIVSILLTTWMAYNISRFFSSSGHHRVVDVVRIFGIIALFFAFRFVFSKRLQQRIDQRFFREAYSTEQVLSEISDEARTFTEVAPLLNTITQRIGDTLHVDRIAVFLRSGDTYHLQLATGAPLAASFTLPATSTTITTLTRGRSPANVYRDDPSSWLVDASEAERTALADLSTELLVPLPGRKNLAGVMALGPKRSEEPYSRTDRQLLQSIASQTGLALENAELLEHLTTEISHRERISREMEIAREVQERLYPQVYPNLPGIDLAGFCRPAQAVGGDYYDFFILPPYRGDEERLALALGDISGKGISAALLMASLRASLRSAAQLQPGDLATLMRHVNRLVYESSTTNRYATFFYAELDPETRVLTYVNAGHNPPLVLRGTETIPLEATGTVIGLIPNVVYTRSAVRLQPGDVLIAFTDGISEAMNAAEEEWGEANMVAAAQTLLTQPACSTTAQQLITCIVQAADRFTAGAPQHDDMTLLICAIH
ncbi:sigma-B regulation protein RsbU (phosphoserine phosphatase) [Edaphobacter aggregans]|uniref:Sigma-B regulation protein RsbU (Phosphoserine phosphatase) n=1 Tax=Edaphobacter aggregans TaxID=570835 RepID=A0A3R9QJE5_9BACT|nr:SpoIIE family protein phosphatase [Edaphobacter aggregans]RSL17916.1 sigma-B regulation protein RsbU (phosphoserine phosphatase) [Edaphobacter aggregans]